MRALVQENSVLQQPPFQDCEHHVDLQLLQEPIQSSSISNTMKPSPTKEQLKNDKGNREPADKILEKF